MKDARNFLIVALLALGVWAVPGGGNAANLVGALLFVFITAALGLFAGRLYREHRTSLYSLGDRWRAVLYAAAAVAVVTIAAGPKLFATGAGTVGWFALMGGAGYALYAVWRHSRAY